MGRDSARMSVQLQQPRSKAELGGAPAVLLPQSGMRPWHTKRRPDNQSRPVPALYSNITLIRHNRKFMLFMTTVDRRVQDEWRTSCRCDRSGKEGFPATHILPRGPSRVISDESYDWGLGVVSTLPDPACVANLSSSTLPSSPRKAWFRGRL